MLTREFQQASCGLLAALGVSDQEAHAWLDALSLEALKCLKEALRCSLGPAQSNPLCLGSVPCRQLIDAGCRVTRRPPASHYSTPDGLCALEYWFMRLGSAVIAGSRGEIKMHDSEHEVCSLLLDAAEWEVGAGGFKPCLDPSLVGGDEAHGAAQQPQVEAAGAEHGLGCSILGIAVFFGSAALVRKVLALFPGMAACRQSSAFLDLAFDALGNRLRSLRDPMQGAWMPWHAEPVCTFCAVVESLLAAGVPARAVDLQAAAPALTLRSRRLQQPPLPNLQCPNWARSELGFLSLVTGGVVWSAEVHSVFPVAFHRAVRTLLLINSCRGFGAAASDSGGRQRRRGGAGRRAGGGAIVGVQLPGELMLHVLLLASCPLPAWVPQLHPFAC